MFSAFRRSKIVAAVILVISLVLIVLIWRRDQGMPVAVPIVASVITLGLGIIAGRLFGGLLANMENTRYLGYLHMELDPEKFISVYKNVPDKVRPANGEQASICRCYLADGYWASGDFSAALRVLGDKPEKSDGVIGLYEIKHATSLLASGDFEEAGRSLEELREAVRKTKGKKPALSANLRDNLEFLEQYRSVLTGGETNKAWLEEAFGRAQYNLRRLEIAHLLALIAVKNGDRKEAAQRLSYMKEQGGKTFFPKLADEIREKKLAQQKQK